MNFHFPSLFRPKPSLEEFAAMRDRALVAETKAVLLENIVEHANRPRREIRKDAGSYLAAKSETTQRLMRLQGRS